MDGYSMISTNYKIMTKSLSSKLADNNSSNSQESGWTLYLEDFFIANNKYEKMNEHNNKQFTYSFRSDYQTSSMVSDAAFGDDDDDDDQELMDTATSSTFPTQCFNNVDDVDHFNVISNVQETGQISHQASNLKHFQNEQRNDNCNNYPQEDGESGPKQAEEGINMEALLRRKGLCLVPISLLLNYLK